MFQTSKMRFEFISPTNLIQTPITHSKRSSLTKAMTSTHNDDSSKSDAKNNCKETKPKKEKKGRLYVCKVCQKPCTRFINVPKHIEYLHLRDEDIKNIVINAIKDEKDVEFDLKDDDKKYKKSTSRVYYCSSCKIPTYKFIVLGLNDKRSLLYYYDEQYRDRIHRYKRKKPRTVMKNENSVKGLKVLEKLKSQNLIKT